MEARGPALNLHLQHLAYLREFARRGTVTGAAEALHVSQPALSQALAEMERRLKAPLFEGRGRGRRLTAAGREVLAYAEAVLARTEEVQRRLEARRRGEVGRLRVGMIDAVMLYVLPQVVRRFRRERPEVDLQLTVAPSHELLQALRRFDLDLAVAVGPGDEDLRAEDLRRESLYIYAPPGSRGRDLERAEWILYPGASRTRALIEEALLARGVRPRITLESGSPEVLRQLVALGLGWSVLPEAVAAGAGEPLRRVGSRPLAERPLVLLSRRGAPEDPLVDEFRRRCREA